MRKKMRLFSAFLAMILLLQNAVPAAASGNAAGWGKTGEDQDTNPLVIPEGTLEIEDNQYAGTDYTSVVIPDSVVRIGIGAFRGCTSLKSVTMGNGVAQIGFDAFYGTGLTSVSLPDSVTEIGSGAFRNCASLTSVKLSSRLTVIPDYLFYGCESLESISVPDSVTQIQKLAFGRCAALKTVEIGSGLQQFVPAGDYDYDYDYDYGGGRLAGLFPGCGALERITVSSENPYYASDTSGILYGRQDQSLLYCPVMLADTEVLVPEGIRKVEKAAFYGGSRLSSVRLPESLQSVADLAFYGCSSLQTLTLSEGLTEIGDQAFWGCSSLQTLALPEGLTGLGDEAFYGCSSLQTLTLPEGLTEIGTYAFWGCSSLQTLTLPEGLTSLGVGAFSGGSMLETVTLPGTLREFSSAFSDCGALKEVIVSEGITEIDSGAFSDCVSLERAVLPESLEQIGDSAFLRCGSLAEISLPDGVRSIGDSAFAENGALSRIELPSSVEQIGSSAFSGCTSLSSIVIPAGTQEIGYSAFSGCTSLVSAELPDGVQLDSYLFSGCTSLADVRLPSDLAEIPREAFLGCVSLEQVELPEGLTEIRDRAFRESGLTSVSLPAGLESLGGGTFENCASLSGTVVIPEKIAYLGRSLFAGCPLLEEVKLPEGLQGISAYAFRGCASLTEIVIPGQVAYVNRDAFRDCTSLRRVTIYGENVNLNTSAFSGCTALESFSGLAGSTAESYAQRLGIPFTVIGEVKAPELETMEANIGMAQSGEGKEIYVRTIVSEQSVFDTVILEYSWDGEQYTEFGRTGKRDASWSVPVPAPKEEQIFLRAYACRDELRGEPVLQMVVLDTTVPEVPGSPSVAAESGYLKLSWEYGLAPEDFKAFYIYRSESPDSGFERIAEIAAIGYFDSEVESGHTYYYYVTAMDEWGHESAHGGIVSASYEDTEAPSLETDPAPGETQYRNMVLRYMLHDNSGRARAVISYRKQGEEQFTEIERTDFLPAEEVLLFRWDISELESGVYELSLTAEDMAGLFSQPVILTVSIEQYEALSAPRLTAEGGFRQVKLSWDCDVSDRLLDHYTVYRRPAGETGGKFEEIASVRGNAYTDRPDPGLYQYQVEAVNIFGYTEESSPVTAAALSDDEEAPLAAASPASPSVYPGAEVIFDASASSDNDRIASYAWVFGDGSEEQQGVTVSHAYEEAGTYTVTLTVTDASGNTGRITIPVTVLAADEASGKRAVSVRVTDSDSGEPVEGARVIFDRADGDGEPEGGMSAVTDANGEAQVLLDAETVYNVAAMKDGSEYRISDGQIETEEAKDTAEPQREELQLSRVHYLVGEVETKELTAEEIKEAGIDTEDPMNRHVTEFTLTLEYSVEGQPYQLPITYYVNAKGRLIRLSESGGSDPGGGVFDSDDLEGWGYSSVLGYYTVFMDPENNPYIIVIEGRVGWLKQMFSVSLILANTSEEDWVENTQAVLTLPEGLSLAGMTGAAQSLTHSLGTLEAGGEKTSTWYVRGDSPGSYDLFIDVTGTYYPEPAEPFQLRFVTPSPIEVTDPSQALSLHIGNIPRRVVNGSSYPIDFTLTNTSEKTLNFVTLELRGGGNSQEFSAETLAPGEQKTFSYDIYVNFTDQGPGVAFRLKRMTYVCSSSIPTTFSFAADEEGDGLTHAFSLYTDEQEPKQVERLRYSMGSYSFDKTEEDDTDFDCLHLYSEVSNLIPEEGTGGRAEQVRVKITAPDGFSFDEFELKQEYEYTIDAIEIGASAEVEEIDLYPVYDGADAGLPEEAEFTCTVEAEGMTPAEDVFAVPVEVNEDMGRIPYRATAAVSSRVTSEGIWGQDDIGFYPDLFAETFDSASTQYNRGAAELLLYLSSSVYRYHDIEQALLNLGFSNIRGYAFDPADTDAVQETTDPDSVACVFAAKKILVGDEIQVLAAVVVRGTVGQEWYGNFNVGTGSEHASFYNASQDVLARFSEYMEEQAIPREQTKLLITGHSRGAAAANLFAAEMDRSLAYADQEDIYAYTFATPNVTTKEEISSSIYNNIFNIVNPKDFVAFVPLYEWGYGKYGNILEFPAMYTAEYDACIPYVEQMFQAITGGAFRDLPNSVYDMRSLLYQLAPSAEAYETRGVSRQDVLKWMDQARFLLLAGSALTGPGPAAPAINALMDLLGSAVSSAEEETFTAHTLGNLAAYTTLTIPAALQRDFSYPHAVETYISWLSAADPQPARSWYHGKLATVNCPVDLEIYNESGELVGRVTENLPDLSVAGGLSVSVSGDSKSVWMPDGEEYTIVFTGNGTGAMTYTVAEFGETGIRTRQLVFADIPLSEGMVYRGSVSGKAGAAAENYALRSEDGTAYLPAMDLSGEELSAVRTEVRITGEGQVTGAGSHSAGDYVTLTALASPGYRFAGWYRDGELAGTEARYGFVIFEDTCLEARFDTVLSVPEVTAEYQEGMTLGDISLPEGWQWVTDEIQPVHGEESFLAYYTPSEEEASRYSELAGWDSENGRLTVSVPVRTMRAHHFTDVSGQDWFSDAVDFVYDKGIMTGNLEQTEFSPYAWLARVEIATVLHRMEGTPETDAENPFPDVPGQAWYTPAVIWANAAGIATGYSNGYFGAGDYVTREQLAVLMYRYAGYKGYSVGGRADLDRYQDADRISGFAREAMEWAVAEGIISGKYEQTRLDPQGGASRAECAVIIMRFMERYSAE